jgi:hypothetical protein
MMLPSRRAWRRRRSACSPSSRAARWTRKPASTRQDPARDAPRGRRAKRRQPAPTTLYYGTVDATALWICLLHDAWRWGLPQSDVEAIAPALEAALGWLRDHADADGDSFWVRRRERAWSCQPGLEGLRDAVRFADGTIADLHRAVRGAGLCVSGCQRRPAARPARPAGRRRLAASSAAMATRFREQFWVVAPPAVPRARPRR